MNYCHHLPAGLHGEQDSHGRTETDNGGGRGEPRIVSPWSVDDTVCNIRFDSEVGNAAVSIMRTLHALYHFAPSGQDCYNRQYDIGKHVKRHLETLFTVSV